MEYNYSKQIVEALLFASDVPLSESKIQTYVDELDRKTILQIIEDLNAEYKASHRAFTITRVAGGFQLVTRPEFSHWIKKFFKGKAKPKLTQASLEALSIIAFKQPISRPQIEAIRGIQSDGVIKNLLERNLITIAGRADTVGRPLLYKTTDEFLRYFGINQISDLPKPKEIEELLTGAEDIMETIRIPSAQLGQRELFSPSNKNELEDDETE